MSSSDGNRRYGNVRVASLLASNQVAQIIGPSLNRVGLVFTASAVATYTVSTDPQVALGQGLMVFQGAALELTIEKHGNAVQRAWYAITAGTAPFFIGYLETMQD